VVACIEFAEAVLKTFGFSEFKVELSTWDPKDRANYTGSDENWALAVRGLQSALDRKGIAYKIIPGEAAFYGPKIDVKIVDVLGRLWQLSTVQFDFTLPARFELEYVGEDGERHQPVMVHRALFGSVERFFGVLIEHYAGAFPLWLAPVQVGLVPISERHHAYAMKVEAELKAAGLRVEIDDRNEKMNGKIRDFANQKTPYILVFGDKEEAAGSVSVRTRAKGDQGSVPLADFIAKCKALVALAKAQSLEDTVSMATQPVFDPPVSVEQYLSTVFEHDCEYVDGIIAERDLGEFEHAFLQLFLGSIFVAHRADWGVIAVSEQRVQTQPDHFRVPDLTILRAGSPRECILTRPPLLVIEIQSPEDTLRRTAAKAAEYLAFGIEHVWIVDPTARVGYRGTGNGLELARSGELAIPETPIRIVLADLFAELDRV
jgi:Uma2 family endonuclease